MNVLFDPFPETVGVGGKEYGIVTDFREWIKFTELLRNAEQLDARILQMILEWYVDDRPEDVVASITALQRFLCAEEIYQEGERLTGEEWEDHTEVEAGSPAEAFSFRQDAICIYSAFMEVYGIDIETIPYMH